MDGYKTLKAGQAVVFNIVQGPKGLHAVEIKDAAAAAAEAARALGEPQSETAKA
jgi:CspA family cold shock protein